MKIAIIILFVIGFLLTSAFSLNDASAAAGDITPIRVQNHVALGEGSSANLQHDTNGSYNSMVQVDSDTYALAYQNDGGYISTFTISADGSTITEVESIEHDDTSGSHSSLVQVDADTYALAYEGGTGYTGYISTFDIDSDGDITPIRVQNHVALGEGSSANLEHDAAYGKNNSMVQVDADTYALAYRGADYDGYISTFTISADGSTITEVESIEHDAEYANHNSMVQVDADTYAVAYEGGSDNGYISTFDIDSGGDITPIRVQNHVALGEGSSANLEYDTGNGQFNSLVQVDADTYALAYEGASANGFISTFTISADGDTITVVETLEHDTSTGWYNSLVQVDSDTYAVAYRGDGGDGFISTFDIDSGGDITPLRVANHVALGEGSSANLEHDAESGYDNFLVQVDADTYALAYDGDADDAGYISTFTIDGTSVSSSSGCYDCIPPKLQQAQIQISSGQKIIATGDDPLHITANVGDEVTVILNVTDNKSIQTIPFAALYTNYQEKPDSMNTYYANNFDNLKQVSTSFYEWNIRADDVPYDYDGTITWSDNTPTVVTDEITEENFKFKNDDNVLEYFMMPFTFTMNQPMDATSIVAKVYDASGNRLHETLPVTLEIIPKETVVLSDDEEIAILDQGDVIITPTDDTTPLFNEAVLFTVLSQWSGYSQVTSDDAELLSSLGLQGESLPAWTKNLGEWVIQEKLDVSELITAINYVHNNQ